MINDYMLAFGAGFVAFPLVLSALMWMLEDRYPERTHHTCDDGRGCEYWPSPCPKNHVSREAGSYDT